MKILDTIKNFLYKKENLPHHFFLIESSSLSCADVKEVLDGDRVGYFFDKHYDSFGIQDVRTLIQLQNEKTDLCSVYIISFTKITPEAQNALLKALEEPKNNKIFFFITSSLRNLLPALQSRSYSLFDRGTELEAPHADLVLEDFLGKSLQERFDLIKKITDKKHKPEPLSKTDLVHFLNYCELHYKTEKNAFMLKKIISLRKYVQSKGASMKMILDDLAMSIELIKKHVK